ncbi:hypothetical protein FGG08_005916 [Glutinoglossum americanum]|uniref:UBC core domain-containing protein n=1 Tax=Glutinoglossum americanum TaxID=1670608 RepID=A0A9P8HX91_9PEZI|nr:hypothetical protein FGG08_005916 [Glutinoglossum americanum]
MTMNSTTLRRLTSEHSSLHTAGLPPNYLFPPSSSSVSYEAGDDLTQLTVLLAGPQGTPYANGLWKLQLKIPSDYPRSPPKAVFRTRIWHPNVEEGAGGVCVDTLKGGWGVGVTLRDVLVTISCLLINPNPDSALNAAAGQLLQDDYEAFARQARLMTSIHAPVPKELRDRVWEAKRRGEDPEMVGRINDGYGAGEEKRVGGKGAASGGAAVVGVVMKRKQPHPSTAKAESKSEGSGTNGLSQPRLEPTALPTPLTTHFPPPLPASDLASDSETEASSTKENNPSHSPIRKPAATPHGTKRPLSALPTPSPDADSYYLIEDDDDDDTEDIPSGHMSASERNIIANNANTDTRRQTAAEEDDEGPQRKSPRLMERVRDVNTAAIGPGDNSTIFITPYEDNKNLATTAPSTPPTDPTTSTTTTAKPPNTPTNEGKENHLFSNSSPSAEPLLNRPPTVLRKPNTTASAPPQTTTTTTTEPASKLPVRPGSGARKPNGTPGEKGRGGKNSGGVKSGRVGLRRL